MKKNLIFVALSGLATMASAQWSWSSPVETLTNNDRALIASSLTSPIYDDLLEVSRLVTFPGGDYHGIRTDIWSNGEPAGGFKLFGNFAKATSGSVTLGDITGVYGEANDGQQNIGGDFKGSSIDGTTNNYGVNGVAMGDPISGNWGGAFYAGGAGGLNTGVLGDADGTPTGRNIGVFGIARGNSGQGNLGGYFAFNTSTSSSSTNWAVYSNGSSLAAGTWQNSDRKLKDNIRGITNAIEKINLLKPSIYTFRTEEFKGMNLPSGDQLGLIAQDLEMVFPNCVRQSGKIEEKNKNGEIIASIPDHKVVNYVSLIPVLIAGIQEQQAQIETQANTNNELKAQISELQKQMSALSGGRTGNTTGINQLNSAVEGFVLDQNIPNPFNEETVINYSLPKEIKNAALTVYDLSGKQLTSFHLDLNAKTITVTSDKLSAGIYIYAIMADGKILDSKKMIVADK
ncbi:MAG: tail fiber domain-containing protein [Bacteroidota bacterium]